MVVWSINNLGAFACPHRLYPTFSAFKCPNHSFALATVYHAFAIVNHFFIRHNEVILETQLAIENNPEHSADQIRDITRLLDHTTVCTAPYADARGRVNSAWTCAMCELVRWGAANGMRIDPVIGHLNSLVKEKE